VSSGNDVSGFASTCYTLEGTAAPTGNIDFKENSDAETRSFAVGLCNQTGATASYSARHELRYTIIKQTDENERVNVLINYDQIPDIVTDGSGTVSSTKLVDLENNLCADFLFNLSTSYQAFSGMSSYTLNRDHDVTGIFYDPENPGHGFNFTAHEAGFTAYYYGHSSSGERLWLVSGLVKDKLNFYSEITLDMYEVVDGTFGAPELAESHWGTVVITLYDCNSGSAVFDGNDGKLFMNLQRIVGMSDSACP
jgi:hypothetical protein